MKATAQQWNELAAKHAAWIEAMGWANKSYLENLSLIAGEVGEAFDEVLETGVPTKAFPYELADVVLRYANLAMIQGMDFGSMVLTPPKKRPGSIPATLGQVMAAYGRVVNTARGATLGDDFVDYSGEMLSLVLVAGEQAGADLYAVALEKMDINLKRGTRGRLK